MYAEWITAIKRTFRAILDWNLVKKSQTVLLYAFLIEIGIYYLYLKYLYHPLANTELLLRFNWFLPTVMLLNVVLFVSGFLLKNKPKWHISYAMFTGLYYPLTLIALPLAVGFLNIVNGVIFIGVVLISLILFPRFIVYTGLAAYVTVYCMIVGFTLSGHLHYAMAFRPYTLMHPHIEHLYIWASMLYSVVYSVITIYLFDILIRSWKEKELHNEKLSCTDELTNLLNRRGVNEMIDLQMQQARITERETSLIVVDVDNFKMVNDRYGHQQGDVVLQHVANVLRENLRTSDIVGRYGGEEFIILLPFTSIDNAVFVAEMCRKALANTPIEIENGEILYIQASFGVSSTEKSDFDYTELFQQADKALYEAKHNGKNQVRMM